MLQHNKASGQVMDNKELPIEDAAPVLECDGRRSSNAIGTACAVNGAVIGDAGPTTGLYGVLLVM